jgi:hypothetical protein
MSRTIRNEHYQPKDPMSHNPDIHQIIQDIELREYLDELDEEEQQDREDFEEENYPNPNV